MTTPRPLVGVMLLAAAAALLAPAPGRADDRDLLWSRGANPNVLMIVDSSGSMANDLSDKFGYIASGDDPHSKMFQVKTAVSWFASAHPAYNLGFTFYERENTVFGQHLFLYRLRNEEGDGGLDFSWSFLVSPGGSIDGYYAYSKYTGYASQHVHIGAGGLMRMGDMEPLSGNRYLEQGLDNPGFWGPYFGSDGRDHMVDWGNSNNNYRVYFNGTRYTGYYKVDAWLEEPTAGTGYYYPAYAWNSEVQNAMVTFSQLNESKAPQVFDPAVSPQVKLDAYDALRSGRETLQAVLDANQIGLKDLTLHVTLTECSGYRAYIDASGQCRGGNWIQQGSITRAVQSAGGLAPSAVDAADATPGTYPPAFMVNEYGTLYSPADYMVTDFYSNSTCNGWEGALQDVTKVPVIPIPTDDDPDLTPMLIHYLSPMGQMQMFFPTRSDGPKYWPTRWDDAPQCDTGQAGDSYCGVWITDRSMYDYGSTPIKNSLNDSQQYFEQVIFDRPDPLKACRKNFIILLTDGLETCSNTNTTCTAATDLGKRDIPVFVIAYGLGTNGNALQCIADNSRGDIYFPNTLDELLEALRKIGQSIDERSRGFASPSVPSVELSTNEKGYISTFLPLNGRSIWEGHLRAYRVDPATGRIPLSCQVASDSTTLCYPKVTQAKWDAGEVLAETAPANRNLFYGTNAGTPTGVRTSFLVDTSTQVPLWNRIFNDTKTSLTSTEIARLSSIVGFMRGDRDATEYRFPANVGGTDSVPSVGVGKLGDIFHSAPTLLGRPDCFACYNQNAYDYRNAFYAPNFKRRSVLFFGADDGFMHALDAGFMDRDPELPGQYDDGTGRELFGFAPNAVMPAFDNLAEGTAHYYTVDGTPTLADVYIKRTSTATVPEWRSVLLFGERQGGDSVVCLDVTRPDPYSDGVPQPADTTTYMPGCLNDSSTACGGLAYPALRWEFSDSADGDGDGYPDMGRTWSRPTVAWVKVHAAGSDTEELRNVAIFGGGYERTLTGGNYLYMVDIETGKTLLKLRAGGSVPGEVALVDYNLDGVIERVYWGDAAGNLWRLTTTSAAAYDSSTGKITCSSGNCSGWPVTKLLDTSSQARQPFFLRPVVVLAGFSDTGAPLFAVGVGAGNREDLFVDNTPNNHFYFVLDRNDGTTVTPAQLQPLTADSSAATQNFLVNDTTRGWALELGTNEKVNTPAIAVNSYLYFSTFTPADGTALVPDPAHPGEYLCRQNGNARTYVVSYLNANPNPALPGRYQQLPPEVQMVSELISYVGADGKLHTAQAADLALNEPVAPTAVPGSMVSWRERVQ